MIGVRAPLPRAERAAVWTVCAVSLVLVALSVYVAALYGTHHWGHAGVIATVGSLFFPAVGTVVVLRGGERRVGWTLIGIGIAFSVDSVAAGWGDAYVRGRVEAFGRWACWTDEWIWTFLLAGIWLLLALFPDGRPFRRTGSLFLVWAGAVTVLLLTTRPFHGGRLDDYPSVTTPFPRVPVLREWGDLVGIDVAGPMLISTFLLGLASQVYRYVRSDELRRTQLRWVAWQAGITVVVLLVQQIPVLTPVLSPVSLLLIPLLPLAIGMAMFRERLYDVDRIISRTVTYGLLTGLLGAAYAGIVALASTVAPDNFGSLGVALATLVVAAAFVPARRVLQRLVDRRFDRARVSYRRTAEDFGRLTRGELHPERIESDLLVAVERTMTPAHASVWVIK